jgi:thiamine biosynthesis lipoprotein
VKAAATVLALGVTLAADDARRQLVVRDVYLMGTRAHLATYAATRERGLLTLETALAVLEHTERELSTWRESSDISTLNRQPIGTPWRANPRLCRMFEHVWRWHDATGGAFDPGIGRLLAAWGVHGRGAVPNQQVMATAKALSGLSLLSFNESQCMLTRRAEVSLDVGAFGKGEALDRVEAALGREPWMVDLGGQVSVGGDAPADGWRIAIAHPIHRDRPVVHLSLSAGSLSTSGGSERDLVVDGTRVSHILDPRTGQPASFTGSVVVWHPSGLAADALSTALFVMGPEIGRRWAETNGISALYLMPNGDGVRLEATAEFRRAPGVRVIGRE